VSMGVRVRGQCRGAVQRLERASFSLAISSRAAASQACWPKLSSEPGSAASAKPAPTRVVNIGVACPNGRVNA
jgi:hypothetical protein